MTVPFTFANQTGNIPLAELDANFTALDAYANVAGTVSGNSQPNITDVGTLTYLSSSGNITADYFIGNGAALTGIVAISNYGNSNVAAYLPVDPTIFGINSNVIATNSNVANTNSNVARTNSNVANTNSNVANLENSVATSFSNVNSNVANTNSNVANLASNITTLQGQVYANANVAAYLPTFTGNVSANYFIGDGSLLTNLPAGSNYSNANVASYLPVYTGNIGSGNIGVTGAVTALGEITTFANVVVSPGGFFIGDGNLLANVNAITLDGAAPSITNVTDTIVLRDPSGNVEANFFIGDGSQLTNLPSGNYSNSNVQSYLETLSSNVSTTGNISANYFAGNGSQLTGITATANTGDITFTDSQISSITNIIGINGNSYVTVSSANAEVTVDTNGAQIVSDVGTSNFTWDFSNDGNLTAPLNIIANGASPAPIIQNFTFDSFNGIISSLGYGFDISAKQSPVSGAGYNLVLSAGSGVANIGGNVNLNAGFGSGAANGNINFGSGPYTWSMNNDGSTTFGSGSILTGDPASFTLNPTYTEVIDLRDNTTTGFYTNSGQYIIQANGTYSWSFDATGNLQTPAQPDTEIKSVGNDTNSISLAWRAAGNIAASRFTANLFGAYISVNNGADPEYQWQFSPTGNLTLPGSISAVGNVNSNNVIASGIVSATGNVRGGNFNTDGTANVGNLIVANTANIVNITATGLSNFGSNANVTITGGNAGETLTTDGTGNLYWSVPQAGNTTTQSGANTTVNVDFSTNSLQLVYLPTGPVTINLSNYTSGAQARVIVRYGATPYSITLGIGNVQQSTEGLLVIPTSGGGGHNINGDQSVQLLYTCFDNTADNCYVASTFL